MSLGVYWDKKRIGELELTGERTREFDIVDASLGGGGRPAIQPPTLTRRSPPSREMVGT
jgi:hypothetical protein